MLGKIGSVTIGNGFSINDKDHRIVYPSDRLTKFLNVDPNNTNAIEIYCKNYTLIPRELTNHWFEDEQKPIKEIAKHIVEGTISNTDLKKVNHEIKNISSSLRFIDGDAIGLINLTLSNENDYMHIDPKRHPESVVLTKTYPNSIASLYEDLSKFILKKDH